MPVKTFYSTVRLEGEVALHGVIINVRGVEVIYIEFGRCDFPHIRESSSNFRRWREGVTISITVFYRMEVALENLSRSINLRKMPIYLPKIPTNLRHLIHCSCITNLRRNLYRRCPRIH